ncbi:MarR family winged helix-turn-helix transcriptional regulator [Paracoccus sp. J55]|uniref:MarR family winged helix-turn-helix transcriptional regulator n=1 Tax=Paracoccus sp. J55 TaxID=935849 RepID=UPI0004B17E35|nr:MarR family transcriptional regulator [Paracoccus sp. J55]
MSDFDKDLEFVFSIADILRYKRAGFAKDIARVAPELTPGAARILVFAGRDAPISQVALARRTSLEPMTISGFVGFLERQGFITRTAAPEDRRSKIIRLTEKGEDCVARILVCMRRSEAMSKATVSEVEWQCTLQVLDRVRRQLSEAEEGDAMEDRSSGAKQSIN